jgi:hypothetical protein
VPLGPLSSQQLKLAVTAVTLVQDGLRKPGLHKHGIQQLPPQVIALVPHGPPQVTALVPHGLPPQVPPLIPLGLPTQVLVLVPRTPSQVTALVAQAGAIKITTAVFNVCYNLKLLG